MTGVGAAWELGNAWLQLNDMGFTAMNDRMSPRQFQEADGVEDWRVVGEGACAYFRTRSFAESARLVQAIGELDGVEVHPPAGRRQPSLRRSQRLRS